MDRLARFAWSVLAYNIFVVLWGAYVRASGSGAGCGSHWPLCNGEILPRAPEVATLIEFSHRLTSGLALLLVVALFAWVRRARPAGDPTRSAAAATLVFMLGEAALGAGLVLFELVADNRSVARALVMAAHLVSTFLLLGSLTLTAHFADAGRRAAARRHAGATPAGWPSLGRGAVASGVFGMLLVGVSGAVAALGDTLYPPVSLRGALGAAVPDDARTLLQLRLLHPLFSVLVGGLLLALAARLLRHREHPARPHARFVAWLTLAQLGCGALNVWLLAPVWMQLVHLLLADLLWIAFVLMAAVGLRVRAGREAPPARVLSAASSVQPS